MVRKMTKWFFNWFYKIKPPEIPDYKSWGEKGRLGKIGYAEDGSYQMQIQGEKYPISGFPRGHVLLGPLASLKHKIKNLVFNQVFKELEEASKDLKYQTIPVEKMSPSVKELYNALVDLENAEVVPDMKGRIKLIRTVLCHMLQEDDAYRFRWQWAMERMDMKKIKLTDADKYFFRAKYFKVDHSRYDY